MGKIAFDLEKLLGDILSPNGLFVDLLSCNEYTLWYLLRQAGLKGYEPSVRTKAFLTEKSIREVKTFALYQNTNLEILMANLLKFFGVGVINYNKSRGSIEDFIKEGISKNKFVYTLYDHFYNSLADEPRGHDYHGHPITGYNDDEQIYLSLLPDKYKVKYKDLNLMFDHCYKIDDSQRNKYFYLDSHIDLERLSPWMNTIKDEIKCDCHHVINNWREELECFRDYSLEILEILDCSIEERREFALQQRLLFNSMSEGLHGNFIFKLRLIQEVMGIDTNSLEQRFYENRQKGTMIANMYRKASVLIDDEPQLYTDTLHRIAENVNKIFVDESKELFFEFKSIILKEKLIENDH